jgi:hypothetical protein
MEPWRNRDAGQHRPDEEQRDQQPGLLGVELVVLDQRADPDGQCHQVHHAGALRHGQRGAA